MWFLLAIGSDLTFSGAAYAQVFGANNESGTIRMMGTANAIQLRDGDATLTIASGGKLQGYGQVYQSFGGATVVNNGTIAADSAGKTLALNNSFVTNTGNIKVSATLSVGGNLSQSAGHTSVDGTLSLAQTFALNGGLLSGSGSILGNVANIGGIVCPGDSPGLLSISGNYAQGADGLFNVELGGNVAGTSFDQLNVSGAADLTGYINVDLVNGFLPVVGEQFDVMLRSSGSGTFINTLTNAPGLGYTVDFQPTRVVVTISAVPVPEPTSVALALIAGGTTLFFGRRRT